MRLFLVIALLPACMDPSGPVIGRGEVSASSTPADCADLEPRAVRLAGDDRLRQVRLSVEATCMAGELEVEVTLDDPDGAFRLEGLQRGPWQTLSPSSPVEVDVVLEATTPGLYEAQVLFEAEPGAFGAVQVTGEVAEPDTDR